VPDGVGGPLGFGDVNGDGAPDLIVNGAPFSTRPTATLPHAGTEPACRGALLVSETHGVPTLSMPPSRSDAAVLP
jgi:hypothetical protein